MYRLYVDEVGTDGLTHLDEDNHRYLSLTGLAMRIPHARDELKPKLDWIKASVFDHDPDEPLIFHRTHIVQKKRAFGKLNDLAKLDLFDRSIIRVMERSEYTVISALIDKLGMMNQPHWANHHPYHYLMEILVEKYTQFLERKKSTGDIMPEGRKGKKDAALQEAFRKVREKGTYYVPAARIKAAIPFAELKFRYKPQNVAGLQLCDLLAHPSHMLIRSKMAHSVDLGTFCHRVVLHPVGAQVRSGQQRQRSWLRDQVAAINKSGAFAPPDGLMYHLCTDRLAVEPHTGLVSDIAESHLRIKALGQKFATP